MGKNRIFGKRRRQSRKPNTAIMILASITIILLFVWGGLYWKGKSEQALLTQADEETESWIVLQDLDEIQTSEDKKTKIAVDEQTGRAAGETAAPVGHNDSKLSKDGGLTQVIQAEVTDIKSVNKPETQKPDKSVPQKTTKPATQSEAKPDTKSNGKTIPGETRPESTDNPIQDPTMTAAQLHEEQFILVQAKCAQDMKDVLIGAEASIAALDKTNLAAIQELNTKLANGVGEVASACDIQFKQLAQNAKQDDVSPDMITEWEQTFNNMLTELQNETEMRLQQLMQF
ncbi:hypothetical protein [Paenibacillus sp. sgz302251]|uniref:hypothetical protein n=1 Tax=Paenibacillus sp. sgz302251 TaxID=3414493 RepID=UPI003C79ED02